MGVMKITPAAADAIADAHEAKAMEAPKEWRCFHCDEVFNDEASAIHHFGRSECDDPICSVTAERYRDVERQLDEYRTESDAQSRFFYEMGHKHHVAVRDAEQRGYDRGLSDAKAYPEELGLVKAKGTRGLLIRLAALRARLKEPTR